MATRVSLPPITSRTISLDPPKREVRFGTGFLHDSTGAVSNETVKGDAESIITTSGGGILGSTGVNSTANTSDAWATLLSLPRQPQQNPGLFSPAPSASLPVPRSSSYHHIQSHAQPHHHHSHSVGSSSSHSSPAAGGGSLAGLGGGGGGGGNWPMFRGLAARHSSADSLLSLASSETSSLASFAAASDRMVEQEFNRRAALEFVTELTGPQPPSSPAHPLSGERTPTAGAAAAALGATLGGTPSGASVAATLGASLSGDFPLSANELPVALFAVDRDMVCVLWNKRMAELTGWAEAEIMRLGRFAEGRFAERLFRPASAGSPFRRCEDVLRSALFGRDVISADLLLLKRGGSCARVRLFAGARTDALGAVDGAICAVIPAASGMGAGGAALSVASAHGYDVDGGGGGGLPPFAPSFAAGETEEWLQRNASAGSLYGMHSVDEESVGDDSDTASSCSDLYQLGSSSFGSANCGANPGGLRRHVMEPVSSASGRRASGGSSRSGGGCASVGLETGGSGRLSLSASERSASGRLSLGDSETPTEAGGAGGAVVGGEGGATVAVGATGAGGAAGACASAIPPVAPSVAAALTPVRTRTGSRRNSCELPNYAYSSLTGMRRNISSDALNNADTSPHAFHPASAFSSHHPTTTTISTNTSSNTTPTHPLSSSLARLKATTTSRLFPTSSSHHSSHSSQPSTHSSATSSSSPSLVRALIADGVATGGNDLANQLERCGFDVVSATSVQEASWKYEQSALNGTLTPAAAAAAAAADATVTTTNATTATAAAAAAADVATGLPSGMTTGVLFSLVVLDLEQATSRAGQLAIREIRRVEREVLSKRLTLGSSKSGPAKNGPATAGASAGASAGGFGSRGSRSISYSSSHGDLSHSSASSLGGLRVLREEGEEGEGEEVRSVRSAGEQRGGERALGGSGPQAPGASQPSAASAAPASPDRTLIVVVADLGRYDQSSVDAAMEQCILAGVDAFLPRSMHLQQLRTALRKLGLRTKYLVLPASLPRAYPAASSGGGNGSGGGVASGMGVGTGGSGSGNLAVHGGPVPYHAHAHPVAGHAW